MATPSTLHRAMASSMRPLEAYKSWVRDHPFLIQNVERLLQLFAWSPQRFSSSEFAYETYSAAIGLLSLWHENIIHGEQSSAAGNWQTLLTAVELVQTLVEIRGIELERHGKLSRYGPLAVLELVKAWLRLRIWRSTEAQLAVVPSEHEDQIQLYSWQQQDALGAAFQRMRERYGCAQDDCSRSAIASSNTAGSSTAAAAAAAAGQQQASGSLQDKLSALYHPRPATAAHTPPSTATAQQQHAAPHPTPPQVSSPAAGAAAEQPSAPPTSRSSFLPSFRGWLQKPAPAAAGPSQQATSAAGPAAASQPRRPLPPDRELAASMIKMGEVLHIARPVIYVMMLKRHGRTSWLPWVTSLAIDLASTSLHSRAKALMQQAAEQQQREAAAGSAQVQQPYAHLMLASGNTSLLSLALLHAAARSRGQLLPSELRELSVRKVQLLRYLIRSPCFDAFTRHLLQRITHSMSWLPGAAQLGDFVYQLVEGMQQYYSYVEA